MRDSAGVSVRNGLRRLCLVVAAMCVAVLLFGCGKAESEGGVESNEPVEASEVQEGMEVQADASSQGTFDAPSIMKAGMPTGSRLAFDMIEEPTVLSESETDDAERAIRDYTPPKDDLLINNAYTFHFYDNLSGDAKKLYDAIYALMYDARTDGSRFVVTLGDETDPSKFVENAQLALMAVQYDHAELFWAYNGLECEVKAERAYDDPNRYYFSLDKPFKRYYEEMGAFNDAVSAFMADIDVSQEDYVVARHIHDKLIALVTYDNEVAAREENDLAHTAYGALVADSSGVPNHAVCDGYAQAYVYLLQQAGIEATVILGEAGDDANNLGGHAWVAVKLGGEWYEVDPTWDDNRDDWNSALGEFKAAYPDDPVIGYYEMILADPSYTDMMDHYLYNLTTAELSHYIPTDRSVYQFSDGQSLSLLTESVHVRDNEIEGAAASSLMDIAPIANGTAYAYQHVG